MCYQLVELYSQCRCLYYLHPVDRCTLYGSQGHRFDRRTILVGFTCDEHNPKNPPRSYDYSYADSGYHSSSGSGSGRGSGRSSGFNPSCYAGETKASAPEQSDPSPPSQLDPVATAAVDSDSEGERGTKSGKRAPVPFRWDILCWQRLGTKTIQPSIQPFEFRHWRVYLSSFRPRSAGPSNCPSELSYLFVGHDALGHVAAKSGFESSESVSTPAKLPEQNLFYSEQPPPCVKLEPADDTVSPQFHVGSGRSTFTKSSSAPTPPESVFSEPAGSSTDQSERESWPDAESSDSDDQLSSTHEDDVDFPEVDHQFNNTRAEIVHSLLTGFFRQHAGSSNPTGHGAPPSPSSRESFGSSGAPSRPAGKRKQGDSDDDFSSRSGGPQFCKKNKLNPEPDLLFACVFFKKDPVRYHSCGKAGQKRIRDVKQHLRRKHFNPFYCSRCWVTFISERERDEHTRAQDCDLQPEPVRDQLSFDQSIALNKKVNSKATPSMQWFSVWDICFPGHPRPKSPFIDPELSEQLSAFRDYYTEHGPVIILEALSGRNLLNRTSAHEARDMELLGRAVISDSLDQIFESWQESRRSSRTAEISTADSVSETSAGGQPMEPNEDTSAVDAAGMGAWIAASSLPGDSPEMTGEPLLHAPLVAAEEELLPLDWPLDQYFLDQIGSSLANPDYNFG